MEDQYLILMNTYSEANDELIKHQRMNNDKFVKSLELSASIIRFLETFNPFQINRHKEKIKNTYYIFGEILLKTINGGLATNKPGLTDEEKGKLKNALAHFQKVISVDPFHDQARELFKMISMYLTIFSPDLEDNLKLLTNVLQIAPCDYQLHFNLGFMYQRLNNLEKGLEHFKLSFGIIDLILSEQRQNPEKNKDSIDNLNKFKVKCLNNLGGIYYAIQDRELANYYFFKALEILPEDPDIHNQIGVVYTELRIPDKAIHYYSKGIEYADNAHISNDRDMLLASLNMNMGLAYCYEINYPKAIECYNNALKFKPRLSLAYQNKLLDLNYISHMIDDPMYIRNLHFDLSKIYEYVEQDYTISLPNYKVKQEFLGAVNKKKKLKTKLNIGFISGDFICHPVSYFVSCILKYINHDVFNVYCYSLKVMTSQGTYPKCNWKIVKGSSPQQLKSFIENDKIDILFDLASQTGDNRLDTFVLKPAPIQISYCGYPNTSGLSNMDYHITDHFADSDGITPGPGGVVRESTQKYYTEKLIFMNNCFLSYTSSLGEGEKSLPKIVNVQPCTKNNYLTIGSFNRYNKVNDYVLSVWKRILETCPNVRFIIKTKEFSTEKNVKRFWYAFQDENIKDRVRIVEYADTYQEHLVDYNLMDIALDTFPYSGTTTSAEALMMGVPILTLFDTERQYHSQNVTSSFMANCKMEEYIAYSTDEYINKVKYFSEHLDELKSLKQNTRNAFLNGSICNYKDFVNDLEDKLISTYKNHPWK